MKFSGEYLYRVIVISYPEDSLDFYDHDGEKWSEPKPDWQPPGWRPEGNYVEIMGTSEFVWPVTNQVYGSQGTARKRAKLLESYGATAIVERSSQITWPKGSA